MKKMPYQGFTLIELSIVLVIIGLIVGGVMVGQDLIAAAKMRQLVGKYQSLSTALNTFKLKYNCLPGDCNNATIFFGGPCPGVYSLSGDTETCNGNGNRKIESWIETRYVCQQLRRAGLVGGNCKGGLDSSPPNSGVQGDFNAIPSEFNDQTVIDMRYMYRGMWNIIYSPHFKDRNYIHLGTETVNSIDSSIYIGDNRMTMEQARVFDEKIDDGRPTTGSLIQFNHFCGNHTTNEYTGTSPIYSRCLSAYATSF